MVVQTIRYGGGVSVTEKSDCFLEANIDTLAGVSELAERFARRRNSQAVRWYVLTLPSCHRDRPSACKGSWTAASVAASRDSSSSLPRT